MTREDIKSLLSHTKALYPRFDAVEKDGEHFRINTEVTDAWLRSIGWMSIEDAMKILDRHMKSEQGDKAPTIRTWLRAAQKKEDAGRCTATLDRARKIIVWEPEEGGRKYEMPVTWNPVRGLWETEDGYGYPD